MVPHLPTRLAGVEVLDVLPAEELPVVALLTAPGEGEASSAVVLGEVPAGALDRDVPGLLARERATGAEGTLVAVPVPGDGRSGGLEQLLLVGAGARTLQGLRRAGAALGRRVRTTATVALDLRGVSDLDARGVGALVEGLLLASYSFTVTTRPADRTPLERVVVVVGGSAKVRAAHDEAARKAGALAAATCAARDLVNAPARELTPGALAETAQAWLGALPGVSVRVLDEAALAAGGFGGILAVGQGSSRPPRLVEASYSGGAGPRVVLVGKGITFDTGGLSLKPNDGMVAMKTDMGGGAAVLGALAAVAALGLRVRLTALVAAAENMPSDTAQRPGDVITHVGGRTVEVLNTDAEGRLVLADALAHAVATLRPDVLVDVATLTGAMPVALGRRHAGLFASDDRLAAQLETAAADSGERLWRMPLTEDYRQALDSPVADLRNIGDPRLKLQGGSITAALFLQEFTGGLPWAHLDIAGPGRSDAEEHEVTRGGTGYGVRLLTYWLAGLSRR